MYASVWLTGGALWPIDEGMVEQSAVAESPSGVEQGVVLPRDAPCERCGKALAPRYFFVNGRALCEPCFEHARGSVAIALVLGGLSAVLTTALYYGILELTGFRFVLMPILSGVLIGSLVNRGNRDGGRLWLRGYAMALTYVATAMTYLHSVMELSQDDSWGRALSYALVLPLDMAVQFKNVVSLVLLALGMHEAFAFSASHPLRVRGPFPTADLTGLLGRNEAVALSRGASGRPVSGA